jgi:hypothetical protein
MFCCDVNMLTRIGLKVLLCRIRPMSRFLLGQNPRNQMIVKQLRTTSRRRRGKYRYNFMYHHHQKREILALREYSPEFSAANPAARHYIKYEYNILHQRLLYPTIYIFYFYLSMNVASVV